MSKDQVLDLLSQHRGEMAERFGVKNLAIFGSVVRGEASQASDVDVLVEFTGRATFDGFMDLKFYLEDLLHTQVDLVTNKALRESMRAEIQREMIRVA